MRVGSMEGFSADFTGRGCLVSPVPCSGGRVGAVAWEVAEEVELGPSDGLLEGGAPGGLGAEDDGVLTVLGILVRDRASLLVWMDLVVGRGLERRSALVVGVALLTETGLLVAG